jgi:hypothetical protein
MCSGEEYIYPASSAHWQVSPRGCTFDELESLAVALRRALNH